MSEEQEARLAALNEALAQWESAWQQEVQAEKDMRAALAHLQALPEYAYWHEHWGKFGVLYPLTNPPQESGLRALPAWWAYCDAERAVLAAQKARHQATRDLRWRAELCLPSPPEPIKVTPRVTLSVREYCLHIDGEYVWID